jgi:hypothetical protein
LIPFLIKTFANIGIFCVIANKCAFLVGKLFCGFAFSFTQVRVNDFFKELLGRQ